LQDNHPWVVVGRFAIAAKGNEKAKESLRFGLSHPWMQEKRQALFDFSKMTEDAESLSEVLETQQHVLSADFVPIGEARIQVTMLARQQCHFDIPHLLLGICMED
jgi:hypothetical protein